MRITTLIENRVSKLNLVAEHGLAFLIQSGDIKILFDTGQTSNFAHNATQLGHNVSEVNFLAISHGHYDHTGGLAHFIENNNNAPIFLKEGVFDPRFHNEKYIGANQSINTGNERFRFIDSATEIAENIFLIPRTTTFYPLDLHKNNFFVESEGQLIADDFNDEMFMVLKGRKSLTILSSCSHNGISNMVETARRHFNLPVKRVVGGFHLKNDERGAAQHIAKYFNTINLKQIHTCHCTGIDKYIEIREQFMGNTRYLETGDVIEL